LNEPLAQHLQVFVDRDVEQWSSAPPQTASSELNSPFAREFLNDLKMWMGKADAEARGFKETRLIEKLDWLESAVLPVQPILLVRDPRSVVASIVTKPKLAEYWVPKEQLRHLPASPLRQQAESDVVTRNALVWNHRYAVLSKALEGRPHLVVRLESLMGNPAAVLRDISRFIGVEPNREQVAAVQASWTLPAEGTYSVRRDPAHVLDTWRRVLTEQQHEQVVEAAGPMMEKFGYRLDMARVAARSGAEIA
jgi:hypothetical protein